MIVQNALTQRSQEIELIKQFKPVEFEFLPLSRRTWFLANELQNLARF